MTSINIPVVLEAIPVNLGIRLALQIIVWPSNQYCGKKDCFLPHFEWLKNVVFLALRAFLLDKKLYDQFASYLDLIVYMNHSWTQLSLYLF